MDPSPSTLCERCQVLEFDDSSIGFQGGTEAGGYYLQTDSRETFGGYQLDYNLLDLLPDLPTLSESSRRGCSFCSILRQAIQECNLSKQYVFIQLHLYSRGRGEQDYYGVSTLLVKVLAVEDKKHVNLLFTIDSSSGLCNEWLLMNRPPEENVLCPKNIQWIKECLAESVDTGDPRGQDAGDLHRLKYLPLRLLDLMPDGDYDCRLVTTDSETLPPDTKYLALSYCWGSPEDAETQFKTESSSFSDRKRGFMDDQVPSGIRDAFKVTRTLGIRYLWVDALCILQGDTEDWEKQSAQMAKIFRGAFAVICTAGSDSCHQGFLERNMDTACIRFQSRINPAIHGHYNIRWRSVISNEYDANLDIDGTDMWKCRWGTRGWTFQEENLAQRAIIFGKTKIHYRRTTLLWTENQEPLPNYTELEYSSASIQKLDGTAISGWLEHLQNFFGRQYSNSQDVLPAISGLAALASNGDSRNYLAGVRKPHLHRDLIWLLRFGRTDKSSLLLSLQTCDPYIAPSWSWASRQQGVVVGGFLEQFLFHALPTDVRREYGYVETHVSVVGHNPYGRVSQGRLKFSAVVVRLSQRLSSPRAVVVRLSQRLSSPRNAWDMREYNDEDFYARIMLDWKTEDTEPGAADDLFFMLLGSFEPIDIDSEIGSEDDEDDEDGVYTSDQGASTAALISSSDTSSHSPQAVSSDSTAREEGASLPVDDDPPGSDFSEDACQGRMAYGIIIHPALEPGEFYRVGLWVAPERNGSGGLYYFRDRQESTLTLV